MMKIHPSFADWYRSAAISPPDGLLEKRWVAVENLAKKAKLKMILDWVKLFVVSSPTNSLVPDGFRDAFRSQDATFPSKDNLQELRVLAGAALRRVIEEGGPRAALASLGIASASFGPRAASLPERDHLDAAERALINQARSVREEVAPVTIKHRSLTKSRFQELIPHDKFVSNSLPLVEDPLLTAFAEVGTALSGVAAQTQKSIEQLTHSVRVKEEELNILWWLETGFSKHHKSPFKEIGWKAGVSVLPMELADLTVFVPGHGSAIAVLAQSLQMAGASSAVEVVTLAQAVNAVSRVWREEMCAKYPLDEVATMCPVLHGMHTSLTTEGAEEWLPVYRKSCDISLDLPFPIIQMSLQVYRERMFLKAMAATES